MAVTDILRQFLDAFSEYPMAMIGVFIIGFVIGWLFMGRKR
jgi:hypothetical protein